MPSPVYNTKDFSSSNWTIYNGTTANTISDPDGGTAAWITSATADPVVLDKIRSVWAAAGLWVLTVYVKDVTDVPLFEIIRTQGYGVQANFDILNGAVLLQSGCTATIVSAGSGWWKLTMTGTAPAAASIEIDMSAYATSVLTGQCGIYNLTDTPEIPVTIPTSTAPDFALTALEDGLFPYLSRLPSLNAALGKGPRIFSGVAPHEAALPHITYQVITDTENPHMAGQSGQSEAGVQIDIWTTDSVSRARLAALLRDGCDGLQGTRMGPILIDSMLLTGRQRSVEPAKNEADVWLFRMRMEFKIWYREPLPSMTPDPAWAVPTITSTNTVTATVSAAFVYQITATANPTSYSTVNLPSGLSVDGTSGLITGSPVSSGQASFVVCATNKYGTGSQQVTITTQAAWVAPDGKAWVVG